MKQIPKQITIKVVSDNPCKYDPEQLLDNVAAGAKVTFVNKTAKHVSITFSNQTIFEMALLPLEPNEDHTLVVKDGKGGEVSCMLNCDTTAMIVEKTAMPTVVINRD
jgi:plastocyanin